MEELLVDEERPIRCDSAESTDKKRVRDETDEADHDSLEVKRLRDDLLGVLDDSDPDPVSQDLESVMKSFENELSALSTTKTEQSPGEAQPDLGYLLEASDDELGLPPPPQDISLSVVKSNETTTELVRVQSDSSAVGEFWEFEDQLPNYGSIELGDDGGYVEVDGLFEYSDLGFDSGDVLPWRSESLPAE